MEDCNSGINSEGKLAAEEEEKENEDSDPCEEGKKFKGGRKDILKLEELIQEQPSEFYSIKYWQEMVFTNTKSLALCGGVGAKFVYEFYELSCLLVNMEESPDIADFPQSFQSYFNTRTLPMIAKEMVEPRFENECVI